MTDNSTSEAAFYHGMSSSETRFDEVLRLHKLHLDCGCKIHSVHVPGTYIVTQGTDALSWGNLDKGVMSGEVMMDFVPLNKSALE
eukprot:12491275-Ditylum_brightwellii.AAC.1